MEVAALGLIHGVGQEAAATLHAVCGPQGEEFVLYSTNCTCFETKVKETTFVCRACLGFQQRGVVHNLREKQAPPDKHTTNRRLDTPQKVSLK